MFLAFSTNLSILLNDAKAGVETHGFSGVSVSFSFAALSGSRLYALRRRDAESFRSRLLLARSFFIAL